MDERQAKVLRSLQVALLGAVTPNLRGVGVKWDDTHIHFNCYFDGPVSDEDRATMAVVDTEVLSDFPWSHQVTHDVIRLDFPQWLPRDETSVYQRKEDWSSVPDPDE
jgi:hypothetical protein